MNRRPFWQRPRTAYKAPVFTGLIDWPGLFCRWWRWRAKCTLLVCLTTVQRLFAVTFWHGPGWITQPNFQPSTTGAICADHSAQNSAQCQTGVFRYDRPIQNWMRQRAENSARWIVPFDTMSNVSDRQPYHRHEISLAHPTGAHRLFSQAGAAVCEDVFV